MPYSIVKLDQDLRLAILEKVGVYSVRFSIQETVIFNDIIPQLGRTPQ